MAPLHGGECCRLSHTTIKELRRDHDSLLQRVDELAAVLSRLQVVKASLPQEVSYYERSRGACDATGQAPLFVGLGQAHLEPGQGKICEQHVGYVGKLICLCVVYTMGHRWPHQNYMLCLPYNKFTHAFLNMRILEPSFRHTITIGCGDSRVTGNSAGARHCQNTNNRG